MPPGVWYREAPAARRGQARSCILDAADPQVAVVLGERLARYGFGDGHPFGPDRHDAFMRELKADGVEALVTVLEPRSATREELESFHAPDYLNMVAERSQT